MRPNRLRSLAVEALETISPASFVPVVMTGGGEVGRSTLTPARSRKFDPLPRRSGLDRGMVP